MAMSTCIECEGKYLNRALIKLYQSLIRVLSEPYQSLIRALIEPLKCLKRVLKSLLSLSTGGVACVVVSPAIGRSQVK